MDGKRERSALGVRGWRSAGRDGGRELMLEGISSPYGGEAGGSVEVRPAYALGAGSDLLFSRTDGCLPLVTSCAVPTNKPETAGHHAAIVPLREATEAFRNAVHRVCVRAAAIFKAARERRGLGKHSRQAKPGQAGLGLEGTVALTCSEHFQHSRQQKDNSRFSLPFEPHARHKRPQDLSSRLLLSIPPLALTVPPPPLLLLIPDPLLLPSQTRRLPLVPLGRALHAARRQRPCR